MAGYCMGCRRTVDTLVVAHGLVTQWALCPDCVAEARAADGEPCAPSAGRKAP